MTDTGSGESQHSFRLSPNEKFLFGVKLNGDMLRFGPAGPTLLWAVLSSIVGLTVVALILFIEADEFTFLVWEVDQVIAKVIAVGILLATLFNLISRLRSGTRVTPESVEIRSVFRRRRLAWNSIIGTRIIEDRPVSLFDVGIGESGGVRADVDSSKAYLVRADGSLVELKGFEASAKESGASAGSPTPTEIKIGALRRYRETIVGPWPPPSRKRGSEK